MNSPQYPRQQFLRKQQRTQRHAENYSNEIKPQNHLVNHSENNIVENSYSREDLLQYGHSVNFLKQNVSSVSKDVNEKSFSGLSGSYFFPFSDPQEFPQNSELDAINESSTNTQNLIISTLRFFLICLKTLFIQLQEIIIEFLKSIGEVKSKD